MVDKPANNLKIIIPAILSIAILVSGWGFFGHKKINRLAIFTLPAEMIGFYKKHIEYITDASCNPDRRRYAVAEEGARHYIDLDHYGDSAIAKLPKYWKEATGKIGVDSLQSHGILPWHINFMYNQLRDAFFVRDPKNILRLSAELGHYLADAHVPLHTTSNYDGQKTGQQGIHAFWESRLPELYFEEYEFFVGKCSYIDNIQLRAWSIVANTNMALDSVLNFEQELSKTNGEKKFGFETKGRQTLKVYAKDYSAKYHNMLNGMVERQMKKAVKAIGDFWYTAWVDAGQPDLSKLKNYQPTQEELNERKEELKKWKEMIYNSRKHEDEN